MHQILPDDSGFEPSECTTILAEVVAMVGKNNYQARVQAFEILDFAFMLFRPLQGGKGAQVSTFAGLRIRFAGIQAIHA